MKAKRVLSMVIAAICAVGAVSGCGGRKTTVSFDENGNFVPGDLVELTVWETQGTDYAAQPEFDGDVVGDWLLKKTNVKVKNMYGNDGGQWDAKLTKLIAGNNLPDIVHCGGYQGPAHFSKLDEYNQVWELTPEILQKYAPNVWAKTPANYWEMMSKDGRILGIPYTLNIKDAIFPESSEEEQIKLRTPSYDYADVTFTTGQYLWIRDDILKDIYPNTMTYQELLDLAVEKNAPIGDEMLDIPVYSTDEFVDLLYKIKEGDYKQDGKTVYAFGYAGGTDNWNALSQFGADMYGYKNHFYTSTWNHRTNSIEILLAGDLIRQSAKTQNKMIRDGVIDAESLAHTSAQYKEKVLNGTYAIASLTMVSGDVNEELKRLGKSYRYRPFITQVEAHPDYPAYKERTYWEQSLCFLKSLSEDELYQVLNWINVQYSDEYEKVRHWGPEEAGLYKMDENGKPVFTDERFTKYFIEGDTSVLPEVKDRKGLGNDTRPLEVRPAYISRWNPKIVYDLNNYATNPESAFVFAADSVHTTNVKEFPPANVWNNIYAELPEVVTYWSARDQWENAFKIAFTANSDEDFDAKWDAAVAELNRIVDVKALEEAMTKAALDYIG